MNKKLDLESNFYIKMHDKKVIFLIQNLHNTIRINFYLKRTSLIFFLYIVCVPRECWELLAHVLKFTSCLFLS